VSTKGSRRGVGGKLRRKKNTECQEKILRKRVLKSLSGADKELLTKSVLKGKGFETHMSEKIKKKTRKKGTRNSLRSALKGRRSKR